MKNINTKVLKPSIVAKTQFDFDKKIFWKKDRKCW